MSSKPRKKSPTKTLTLAAPALPAAQAIPSVDTGALASYRDGAALAKENLAVFAAVSAAMTDGMERIGLELVGITRGTLESAAATGTALLGARTLADVVALNGEFARGCLDRMIAGATRLTQLGFAVASEAYEPFGARIERAFMPPARAIVA